MSIRQAYSDWATTYDLDRNLTRDLDQAVTRNILANLHCKSVLELGCGTGKNTALLAEIGERICAIDFSPSMIERAKDKLRFHSCLKRGLHNSELGHRERRCANAYGNFSLIATMG
jgi:ubiquinone/menaquinone biosynthesis C-methylase UbiE